MRTYSDEGIILARRNFSEADRILSIYTKNHGRISAIAKGIRRPTSKKRGHLEIFSYVSFQITDGKGVGLVTEVVTLNNFERLRKNLNKVSLAYFFMEVVGKITHEHERGNNLFDLILSYLERLEKENSLKALRFAFIEDLLVLTGFWPKGKKLLYPDEKLSEVIERNINSVRVGKKVLGL